MREKELRLALVCYGGVSLAVYMHGITKEIWRLARASAAEHAHQPVVGMPAPNDPYRALLAEIGAEAGVGLRVLVDIVAGASAGGINGIFLAQAISAGQSLEPLTELWLERADVDRLLDPDARPLSRLTKFWAVPIAWIMSGRRGGAVARTVEHASRGEVRSKLSRFVRARWFAPPFGGKTFTNLLLDALDAMAAAPAGPSLLPPEQPLDLFVTVTDFNGYPERLQLHSPPEAIETEHRLILPFTDRNSSPRHLGDRAELAFAARATASFPGAFPPFRVDELDAALAERGADWPGRNVFLARVLPRHSAVGDADQAVLIDGSVLANAPFRPVLSALRDRPARREVERRLVYIDPTPSQPGARAARLGDDGLPGFFTTIFGAMSDIPREQPIRDNLETIAQRSSRIRRTVLIIDAIRPEVETAIERACGRTLFLDRPTARRLSTWRAKAQQAAARQAGYAYASYGHLKLSGIVEDETRLMHEMLPAATRPSYAALRAALWHAVRARGLADVGALSISGASEAAIAFFRDHDLGFRIRRLRMLARRIEEIGAAETCAPALVEQVRAAIFAQLAPYLDQQSASHYGAIVATAAACATVDPDAALTMLAKARNLPAIDAQADAALAAALALLPQPERRAMLFAYLGFPFYDIATLPLLEQDGQDEFNPVLVDRIAPEDATGVRAGGAQATLKGIQFNNFGAFFSRTYRENDYLWGRLHGAERLVDIIVSSLPEGTGLAPGRAGAFKRRLFRAILDEERDRLGRVAPLVAALDAEIG